VPEVGGIRLAEKIDALGGREETVLFEDGERVATTGVLVE